MFCQARVIASPSVSSSGEDLSLHAKVGVAHVRTLDGVGHGESDATKVIRVHACVAPDAPAQRRSHG
jgi:hypothetical protein